MLNNVKSRLFSGKKYIILLAMTSLLFFVACEDRSELTAPSAPNTGSADFTRFVSIGNSLTAGYQSGSLYESSQVYSFGKIMADQVGVSYEQPLISEPGIPGKLELHDFTPTIIPNPGMGTPTNLAYAAPYNNLGVPGAIIFDLTDETDFATKSEARGNPYFSIVLRDQQLGASIIKQALNLQPTFINLWIGNNDVLGYATSGGSSGTDATGLLPTDPAVFGFFYNAIATALTDSTGARKIAAANIPDVQNIPFFTTIGPKIGVALIDVIAVNPAVVGLFYQKNGEAVASSFATPEQLIAGDILLTLAASPYASLVGVPTGKFYREVMGGYVPPGIDTTQAFGLHPQNPWPHPYTLDATELALVQTHTGAFNAVIKATVDANSDTWVLVDINSYFAKLADGGLIIDGINFSNSYILGNTFSLDGVHPTTQGYGVVANEFISAINGKFDATIPRVNVSTLPASIGLGNATP
ncbi:MAG: hypothetical protein L3J41_13955 [Melioribacteraceae bacterium]|nr:hypothetical protein [Melioribacteraceae bacterium]